MAKSFFFRHVQNRKWKGEQNKYDEAHKCNGVATKLNDFARSLFWQSHFSCHLHKIECLIHLCICHVHFKKCSSHFILTQSQNRKWQGQRTKYEQIHMNNDFAICRNDSGPKNVSQSFSVWRSHI